MVICVAFQRVFIAVVYFVINSVRKLLDTALYCYFYGELFLAPCQFRKIEQPSFSTVVVT
jgi:hypothetical protein